MPSAGKARVTSAHSRSTAIGAVFFSTSGAMRRAPIGDDPRRLLGKTAVALRPADDLVEPGERRLRVADDARRIRVAAADLQRIGIDLHDLGVAIAGTVQFSVTWSPVSQPMNSTRSALWTMRLAGGAE